MFMTSHFKIFLKIAQIDDSIAAIKNDLQKVTFLFS